MSLQCRERTAKLEEKALEMRRREDELRRVLDQKRDELTRLTAEVFMGSLCVRGASFYPK